jgi:superfamily I DNA/RNA helicase
VLVDEYQDINHGQYRIVRALAADRSSELFVIGDPNQSIYGFRGSDAAYFNRFVKDYPEARSIRLTRNYRSTDAILTASSQVIQTLDDTVCSQRNYSDAPGERTVGFLELASEQAEAVAVGKIIEKMVGGLDFHIRDNGLQGGHGSGQEKSFADFAVLYRTHGQAQAFADAFTKAGIPYQMARPVRNCGESGIDALLSFMRIISGRGTYPDLDAIRDVSVPGIGNAAFKVFKNWGYRNDMSLKTALFQASRLPIPGMTTKTQKRLFEMTSYLSAVEKDVHQLTLPETIRYICENTKLVRVFEKDGKTDLKANLELLLDLAEESRGDMDRFFQTVALQSDTDAYEARVERVALMTIHAAKGLEFPVVFIAGCENGLIPFMKGGVPFDLEEERRLFYVAMTRAERHLYFSRAAKRIVFGRRREMEMSPFVADIEKELIRREAANHAKQQPKKQIQLTLF